MPWRLLRGFSLTNQWQYSQPFEGKFIKVEQSIFPAPPSTLRGVIAQAKNSGIPREIFNSEFLYSDKVAPIYKVEAPDNIWIDRVIAVKGLYYVTEYNWNINIFYWETSNGSGNVPTQQTIETLLVYGAL